MALRLRRPTTEELTPHPVTRALPAIGDRLQDAAVKRYLAAMQRAAADGS